MLRSSQMLGQALERHEGKLCPRQSGRECSERLNMVLVAWGHPKYQSRNRESMRRGEDKSGDSARLIADTARGPKDCTSHTLGEL